MQLDAVVKVGGSLVEGHALDALCAEIAALAGRFRLLIVAGGGPLADAVRDLDQRYGLRATTSHWMAILTMDQLGLLLAERIAGARPVQTEAEIAAALAAGHIPVLLPAALLRAHDPLPHTWDVTSDSIAAWLGGRLGCRRIVLLKSVDGLRRAGRLVAEARSHDLGDGDEVDRALARVLPPGTTCWLVNGTRPARLTELLTTGHTTGTKIVG